MAEIMSDFCSLDCKTSSPGSLHSLNQQRNRQQRSNMENFFQNGLAKPSKTQTKLLLNPGRGRTDLNQPLMRPWRANARESRLGTSTHISANPPIHLLTHPCHVGLMRSSPLPLPGSGTGLRGTDRIEKFVIVSDFFGSQSQQCLGTLRDCPLSSSIKQRAKEDRIGQITNANHSKVPVMLSAVLTHSKIQPTGKQNQEKRCYPPLLSSSFSWGAEGGKEEDTRN